jgi:nucleoside phosphorylase
MLLVVSALKSELSYILQHLSIGPKIPMGTGSLYPAQGIHLLRTGIGRPSVQVTVSKYLLAYTPSHILNIGLAGALTDSLSTGELIAVSAVGGENAAVEYELPIFPGAEHVKTGKVITVGRPVLSRRRKVTLYQKYGKELVDMELFHLAAIAREKAIPVYSIKIVSDQADENAVQEFIKNYRTLGETLGRSIFERLNLTSPGKTNPSNPQQTT